MFKLVELRQLLLAGETRFLGWAVRGARARRHRGPRTPSSSAPCWSPAWPTDRGLPPDELTLSALVRGQPRALALAAVRTRSAALRADTAEMADLLAANRRLAEAGSRRPGRDAAPAVTASRAEEPVRTTYGPGARWETAAARAPRVSHEL